MQPPTRFPKVLMQVPTPAMAILLVEMQLQWQPPWMKQRTILLNDDGSEVDIGTPSPGYHQGGPAGPGVANRGHLECGSEEEGHDAGNIIKEEVVQLALVVYDHTHSSPFPAVF